jgi:osmotically-inducible protein OsmY
MARRKRERSDGEAREGLVIGPTSDGPDVELTGGGAPGSPHSDAQIRSEILERFAASSLAAHRLDVRVNDRAVTLAGAVPDVAAKHLAEHIAESVAGVHAVASELTIGRSVA